jgi:hypothetical protein
MFFLFHAVFNRFNRCIFNLAFSISMLTFVLAMLHFTMKTRLL